MEKGGLHVNSAVPPVLSVTQLNLYIRSVFDGDPHLTQVFVTGEISNFKNYYRSGHLYLSLKDDKCVIKAVMFARYAQRLRFLPEDGMRVIARGHVSVYEASGQYQLYIEDLQPDGIGSLSLAFEQRKAKLQKEGLFSNKRPIPKFPENIGVITSPSGAAVHDIFTVLSRRYPVAEVIFCPVAVQGENAAPQIAGAVRKFNELGCADVLIVGRGGGAVEDLWPFNEEIVARAVAASRIPVISAVGHETDFTICDFAADLRAPTPSAAAELAVPDQADLRLELHSCRQRMERAMSAALEEASRRTDQLAKSPFLRNPLEPLEVRRIKIDHLVSLMNTDLLQMEERCKNRLSAGSGRLNALSPLAVLSRGYAVPCGADGQPIRSVSEIKKGGHMLLKLDDGDIGCVVDSVQARKSKRSEAGTL